MHFVVSIPVKDLFIKNHSHIAIVVSPPGRKTLCRSLGICKGFFRRPLLLWFDEFFNSVRKFALAYGLAIWEWLFWMGTIFAKLLQEHSWICHITCGFATRDMTNSLVLLQKLCKNCPHPEKPFSNSKTISQIKFPYRIEKLVKSQQECPGRKPLSLSKSSLSGVSSTVWG